MPEHYVDLLVNVFGNPHENTYVLVYDAHVSTHTLGQLSGKIKKVIKERIDFDASTLHFGIRVPGTGDLEPVDDDTKVGTLFDRLQLVQ